MMTANNIREKFLKFFESKKHTLVDSDSLVPKDDPTVLFTTAGMQQFKRQFLGHIDDYTSATTSQKCMRTDDLDEVGVTDFHHTFFEMLGNFSFGDYFKKEAIAWGWEFLTDVLGIPADKLYVSVHKDDSEAKAIWVNDIKLPENHIFEMGDKSNFWPADAIKKGPNGPCGPCSEIFFDWGGDGEAHPDSPRFCEVWNLVFTQFERKEGGELIPLPNKNIDTGMGLERLTAVLQGKKNNFQTDIFAPILKAIDEKVSNIEEQPNRNLRYVIADHLRGAVFGINDGVLPSNEGRGYVIKKLIVDMTDIVLRSGHKTAVIHSFVPAVVETMKIPYPELITKAADIQNIIQNVETSYIKIRQQRIPELKKSIEEILKKSETPVKTLGDLTFTYRDTYGLTRPAIEETLSSSVVDSELQNKIMAHFDTLMTQQQEQSRAGSKMTGDVFSDTRLELNLPKTDFLGYEHAYSTSTVLKMFLDDKHVNQAHKGDKLKIVLDKTPFYAESGGQIGDTGFILSEKAEIEVTDTKKIDNIFVHTAEVLEGTVKTDDLVKAEIDVERRMAIMRNHTATHIMQAALREILGEHVQQQGSLVTDERLRFDFSHHSAVTLKQIRKIENFVNSAIRNCDYVTKEYLSIEEAKKSGALAFFAEKYGKTVRVISLSDYSKEFCGGTHLGSSGQIGLFKITTEGAIAQGIRRLEAVTGQTAVEWLQDLESNLDDVAKTLKTSRSDLIARTEQNIQKIKTLEKELETLRLSQSKNEIEDLIKNAEIHNDLKIISHAFKKTDIGMLRKISDTLKQKVDSAVIVLGAQSETNAAVLVTVTDDLVKKGIKANELIKTIAPLINGKGGGRPQLAQAGSKDVHKVEGAIQQANRLIKESVQL